MIKIPFISFSVLLLSNGGENRKLFKMIEKGLSPEDISRETGIDINQIKHFYELYQTKRTAPVLDETHPSYFLNTNENYNELV